MLSSKEISMLIEATGTSVYMTLASTDRKSTRLNSSH